MCNTGQLLWQGRKWGKGGADQKAMQDSVCLCFHINAAECEWVCPGMNWCGIRPGLLLFQLLLFIFIGCWAPSAVVRFMCREKKSEEEIKIFAIKYFRPLVIYEFLWHTILAWHNYQSLWSQSSNGPTIKWIMQADSKDRKQRLTRQGITLRMHNVANNCLTAKG